ncbi:MAG: ABC transporter permease [Clostridiales bacterium]|nr:ABC transporter permease [Clostridiales bacterium]
MAINSNNSAGKALAPAASSRKKVKNPMRKRLFRELKKDWKKYFVLFLLMVFMIGLASGIDVGNDSMMAAIDESYEKYTIENGHFELREKASPALLSMIENEDITVYEQFYKDLSESKTAPNEMKSTSDIDEATGAKPSERLESDEKEVTVRIFKIRNEVNRACVMKGEMPSNADEIAIDNNHAYVNKIKVGDTLYIGESAFTVSGLISSSDYTTLFKKNSDFMFNAVDFDIAVMTEEGWESLPSSVFYQYAFMYNEKPATTAEQKEKADALMEKLAVLSATGGFTDEKAAAEELAVKMQQQDPEVMQLLAEREGDINELKDFVPEYANQAIHFAPEDMGSDKAIMSVLVYIFIGVLAFIFAITTSNTITSESAVIGTLRATGYTRGEILRHYMLMPIIVTLLASAAGNILGYTIFKDAAVALYYNSYSLVTYETLWNMDAFLVTTILPLILMLLINFIVIYRKLRLSPLRFLRKDLRTSKRKKAMRLPSWSFLKRFRLRILFDNMGGYIVLFVGIAFVMLMLAFSIGLPETLDHYKANLDENLISNYQYILKGYKDEEGNVITTSEESAEKYSVASLETIDGAHKGEEISVYGYENESSYIKIDEALSANEIYISSPYSKKFRLSEGDTITLKEKYEDKSYDFVIKGIYDYDGALCVFLPQENFNKIFGLDADAFTGFLSQNAISDINYEDIYTVVTLEEVMSIATQLDHSMGGMMDMVSWVCLVMAVLMMYLLTKIIIEKNATSISMVKVLGYENKEINSLYILLTSLVVLFSAVATAALAILGLAGVFRLYMNSLNGWFDVYISPMGIAKMILILVVSYAIVAIFDTIRIKKIPLADALKNVE